MEPLRINQLIKQLIDQKCTEIKIVFPDFLSSDQMRELLNGLNVIKIDRPSTIPFIIKGYNIWFKLYTFSDQVIIGYITQNSIQYQPLDYF